MWTYLNSDPYYDWLCNLIDTDTDICMPHKKLLSGLHTMQFYSCNNMDNNRAADGMGLRRMFINENKNDPEFVYEFMSVYISRPCSVLEFMIALAMKCGNGLYAHLDQEYPVALWFWKVFCKNLGYDRMHDDNFSQKKFYDRTVGCMSREYNSDGTGGSMFPIRGYTVSDMRTLDIWQQLNRWVREKGEPKW